MCADTDEEAQEKAQGWSFFQFSLVFYNTHGPVVPGSVNLWDEYQKWKQTPAGQKKLSGALIGSPETLRQRLRKYESTHLDQVILLNQAGNNTHEDICSSLELFAQQVMPEFHGREPEHQEWKQKVLAGEIQLDEIDVDPFNTPTNQTPSSKVKAAE
jgi:alkanesulfonate monooxygenase SsuD/methylene tetrahydromethanopterin reductase-like flavin-dependent oxidoreductase (luciferase family)